MRDEPEGDPRQLALRGLYIAQVFAIERFHKKNELKWVGVDRKGRREKAPYLAKNRPLMRASCAMVQRTSTPASVALMAAVHTLPTSPEKGPDNANDKVKGRLERVKLNSIPRSELTVNCSPHARWIREDSTSCLFVLSVSDCGWGVECHAHGCASLCRRVR